MPTFASENFNTKDMYIIPESLTADIQYNQRLIEQYKKGEISGAQLKSNRVPMGIYEQRQDEHYMLHRRSHHSAPVEACG